MGSLLVVVGDSQSGYRDGDVMRAHSRADALAARAEVILNGRGEIMDPDAIKALGAVWDHYRRGRRRPTIEGVVAWWEAARETLPLAARAITAYERYPFTHHECKQFLALHLDREITVDEVTAWPGKSRGARVDWRRIVASGELTAEVDGRTPAPGGPEARDAIPAPPATEADVLDRRVFCFAPGLLPDSIVQGPPPPGSGATAPGNRG